MSSLCGLLASLLPCLALKEKAPVAAAECQDQQAAVPSRPGGARRHQAVAHALTSDSSLLETVRESGNSSVHFVSSLHSHHSQHSQRSHAYGTSAGGGALLPGGGGGGASAILKSLQAFSRPVLLCQLHDLRYSLHPNAMSVMSLAAYDMPPLAPPHHGSTHSATTISVNQAFELLVGAAGLAACGAADSYIDRLLSKYPEARSFFCQKVALALRGPRAGAAAPDSPSIKMETMVEGQLCSLTLTVLPFMASAAAAARDLTIPATAAVRDLTIPATAAARDLTIPATAAARDLTIPATAAARDLTIPATAANVFPALFIELHVELALQLAVQRGSVCMLACKDLVTMLTMDGQRILWQNYASQVRATARKPHPRPSPHLQPAAPHTHTMATIATMQYLTHPTMATMQYMPYPT